MPDLGPLIRSKRTRRLCRLTSCFDPISDVRLISRRQTYGSGALHAKLVFLGVPVTSQIFVRERNSHASLTNGRCNSLDGA